MNSQNLIGDASWLTAKVDKPSLNFLSWWAVNTCGTAFCIKSDGGVGSFKRGVQSFEPQACKAMFVDLLGVSVFAPTPGVLRMSSEERVTYVYSEIVERVALVAKPVDAVFYCGDLWIDTLMANALHAGMITCLTTTLTNELTKCSIDEARWTSALPETDDFLGFIHSVVNTIKAKLLTSAAGAKILMCSHPSHQFKAGALGVSLCY